MPRFHFNVYDGQSLPDREGTDLPDSTTARLRAIEHAGEILQDDASRIGLGEDWRMEVTDERGVILFRLDFVVMEAPVLTHARAVRGELP